MDTQTTFVPYADTGFFSPLIIDYINGVDRVKELYALPPQIESFKKAIDNRAAFTTNRSVLHQALLDQHQDNKTHSATKSNIDLVLKNNTFTVTAGHQLCLFTGPLFFIYKIVSVINMAKQLSKAYPDSNFVPVYWMATEDHDFEEISSVNVFQEKLTWNQNQEGAVGRIDTGSLSEVLEQLKNIIGNSEQGKKLFGQIEQAYRSGESLASATRNFVYQLFQEDGLVVIDGDDTSLKELFKEVMRDELQHQRISKAVEETNSALSEAYKLQVKPRNINLFHLQDGSRIRIEESNEALFQELETHPENFSPNVIMRCMYQETILPNLAYIGGGGEVAYWLQLKAVFELYKIPFPILMLRNSVLHIDKKLGKRFAELGFSKEQVFDSEDTLVKNFVDRNAQSNSDLKQELYMMNTLFDAIEFKLVEVDATLKESVLGERKKMENSFKAMGHRLYKARKRQSEEELNRIKSIKGKLFPNGSLQERHDNIIPMQMKYGNDFINNLKDHLNPFDLRFLILSE